MFKRTEFEISTSPILGLSVIQHLMMSDERGPFGIPIDVQAMTAAGLELAGPIDHINYLQRHRGDTFGFHVSSAGKLITVLPGTLYQAVVADLRDPNTPGYGDHETFELQAGTTIYVPAGYGNAGQALRENSLYLYAADGVFDPANERKVSVHDGQLDVEWLLPVARLSSSDANAPSLAEYTKLIH